MCCIHDMHDRNNAHSVLAAPLAGLEMRSVLNLTPATDAWRSLAIVIFT